MKKVLCGNEMDRMPGWAFRMMAWMFDIADFFRSPGKRLDPFPIHEGQTVVDWGCGTGRYLKPASDRVGNNGKVYAVDIHPLAIRSAERIQHKYGLSNVVARLTDGVSVDIPLHSADLVYALDMFHMVSDPQSFLKLLHSVIKPGGTLILEDGHQPREESRQKVTASGCWQVTEETKTHMVCIPSKPADQ